MDLSSCLKFLIENGEKGGGWFLVLGCFSPVFNLLGFFLMFSFGLKLLHFTRKTNSTPISLNFLQDLRFKNMGNQNDGVFDGDESEVGVEDEEYDVLKLRKLVKIERQRANEAYVDVEEERMATASAAEEAMGMILRLQNDKSSLEIEANQYRRLAEQKQEHDQEIIQSLQWAVMKYESEKCVLEEKLEFCRMKLKEYLTSDEFDQIDASLNHIESELGDSREDCFVDELSDPSIL